MSAVPAWMAWVIGLSVFIVAVIGLVKTMRLGAKTLATFEETMAAMREATITFRDVPDAFKILKEIVAQVRTDSGSSLLVRIRVMPASAGGRRGVRWWRPPPDQQERGKWPLCG